MTNKTHVYNVRQVAEMLGISASTTRYRFGKLVDLGLAKVIAIDPEYAAKIYETNYNIKFLWKHHLRLAGITKKDSLKFDLVEPPIVYHNPFNLVDAVDQRRLSWAEAFYGVE